MLDQRVETVPDCFLLQVPVAHLSVGVEQRIAHRCEVGAKVFCLLFCDTPTSLVEPPTFDGHFQIVHVLLQKERLGVCGVVSGVKQRKERVAGDRAEGPVRVGIVEGGLGLRVEFHRHVVHARIGGEVCEGGG